MGTVSPLPPDGGSGEYVQTLVELDRDGYAPRKSLFNGMTARFELPSGMAETLLDDYRAGFPMPYAFLWRPPDSVAPSHWGRARANHEWLRPQQGRKLISGPVTLVRHDFHFRFEGTSKPDRQIFHRALERLNTNPAQAVFVGDHPEVDVAGARVRACKPFGVGTQVCQERSRPMASSTNLATFSLGWVRTNPASAC